jgi:NAD(P)-dependent dehydrogenase (short-subunit alcohol dehydrogenase family)
MTQVVWITGAGKGIGRALALAMARGGAAVAASARTAADLESLAAEAGAAGGRIVPFALDVTDAAATAAVVAAVDRQLGPIGQAVLNAGTHLPVTAAAFSADPFRQLIETNLMGAVHGLAALVPRFVARRAGRIAVVASLAGYRGLPSAAAYGASKAALIALCEALRPDLERHGVVLQVINPGFVRTPLTDRNDFPMPFLIEADAAARRIVAGLRGDRFEIAFPRRFALLLKLLRCLPYPLYFAATRRLVR